MFKKEIRVIGIDDAPFRKFSKGKVFVIGTVFRGGTLLDGILSTKVNVDGSNSTKKIIEMVNKSKFKPQLRCIFLDGIAVGGFNIIDIQELNKQTKLPVIVVIRKKPDIAKEILKIACTRSHIPEAVRLAHIIASGIVDGESRGRA